MADITKLVDIIQKLVSLGNTVIVIEHNLDVAIQSDWIIDLGPEGGSQGGQIVAQGTPEQVAASNASHTASFLREHVVIDETPFLTPLDLFPRTNSVQKTNFATPTKKLKPQNQYVPIRRILETDESDFDFELSSQSEVDETRLESEEDSEIPTLEESCISKRRSPRILKKCTETPPESQNEKSVKREYETTKQESGDVTDFKSSKRIRSDQSETSNQPSRYNLRKRSKRGD